MDGSFSKNPFVCEPEDTENLPENSGDSPRSGMNKMTSTSSPKTSRRAVQKRVVSVPIKEVEGSRLKGEISTPPSDSWAWRKYGQKPIKGSPYPRGYYRCSSSKGCPARKQVERSRVDPNMLVVTYSCEHNHPWPASRNNHNHHHVHHSSAAVTVDVIVNDASGSNLKDEKTAAIENQQGLSSEEDKFTSLGEASLMVASDEFGWFADLESPSSTMLEGPILAEHRISDADVTMIFSMREEDESLFADLGELPECSVVFRRGVMEREEERRRRCELAPWCGTTN